MAHDDRPIDVDHANERVTCLREDDRNLGPVGRHRARHVEVVAIEGVGEAHIAHGGVEREECGQLFVDARDFALPASVIVSSAQSERRDSRCREIAERPGRRERGNVEPPITEVVVRSRHA